MVFFDFMKPGVFLISPSPGSSDEGSFGDEAWYGNIEYLLNISAIGAFCCVALFLFVKLRSDHTLPSVTGLFAKLVAVWHATSQQIACHCGANAAQFLYTEGGSFSMLFVISVFALGVILPVNLYAGTVVMDDQFSKTTINHIPKGSPLLWVHVLFMILVVWVVHYGITILEERLVSTRFHDGSPTANSVTMFTIMVQGVPRDLAKEKHVLEEYFRNKYPGKVYKVVVPQNLCMLNDLVAKLVKIRNELSWLHAHLDADSAMEERDYTTGYYGENDLSFSPSNSHSSGRLAWFVEHCKELSRYLKELWMWTREQLGFTEHQRLVRLQQTERELERELLLFKEGRAQGAGIAFVICKDIYTTNKAIQDLGPEQQRPIGRFFPLMELQLGASRWKVERAPPASDIYWNHVGSRKISLKIRRVAVNTALVLLLLFCSSPLAAITALRSAGRIINAEAMDKAQSWLVWVQSTNWAASLILQFLPNVLIFVTMYIIVPSALSSLSKFERHLTVSGEQRAALVKMVCFFLVNLILLRALVESSLENLLLRMGHCYLDGEDCKQIENYMSASFLSRSCLSSLAFLITCTFLGISFDLLAPIPWIKRNLRKLKKNDMLQLVPEQTEEHFIESPEDGLERPLMFGSENGASDFTRRQAIHGIDLQGHDLSIYPESTSPQTPKQNFDFAQYYAFNLTVFALTLIYSAFAPLVLPVGAFYFAYRYVVDKYNFLFVYRIRGFPAGNDGKLVDSVLRIMRLCVVLFVLSMLLYLSVQGDSARLQAVFTCGILLVFKLVPSKSDVVQPFVPGIQTVESVIDGPTDYEVFSQPNCDWEAYRV